MSKKIFHKIKKNAVKEKHKAKKFKDLSKSDKDEILEKIFIANGYCV